MADRAISELRPITEIQDSDNFVLEQDGTAMRLMGLTLKEWLLECVDGHGGIANIEKTSTVGLVDTYTIYYADGDITYFTVTNGEKGDKGDKGNTGPVNYITSQEIRYATNNSGRNFPTNESDWKETVPVVPQGNFLWTRGKITYASGTTITLYSVTRFGLDGNGSVRMVNDYSPDSNGNVHLPIPTVSLSHTILTFGS